MNKKVLIATIAGIVITFGLIFWFSTISIKNHRQELKLAVSAQQDVNKACFDNMFKQIAQVAEVAKTKMEVSKEAFKEIYPDLIKGRYDGEKNGALMKWVVESNPQFDLANAANLYDKLETVIKAQREEFFMAQKTLIDKKNAHNLYVTTFPGNIIYNDSDTLAITIITSDKTEEVFKTGKDNDIKIFDKK